MERRFLVKKLGKHIDVFPIPKKVSTSGLVKLRRAKRFLKGAKLVRAKSVRNASDKFLGVKLRVKK